ncbi:MAG: DUF177 domain-containing protein [Paludibacteraceae bacterium]|nr:DUF177 domain-containing protein [Paludibacteraceae bacterium]
MSGQNTNIIDLTRLPIGTHRFDILLDDGFFASVEKSEILSGQVAAKVTLNLREEDYSLSIAVQGTVSVVCDRCLDPMTLEINDEQEIFSEDEEPNDKMVNLQWLAYEIVAINIPLVHCHPTGACNPQMDLLLHSHLCAGQEPEN